jgi:hypothetical protein
LAIILCLAVPPTRGANKPKSRRVASGARETAAIGSLAWGNRSQRRRTPTVDPLRRAIYFGTGNATTYPAAATSDAVMALDMDSGKVLWSYQSQSQFIIIHCQSQKQKPSVAIAFLSVWATTSSHEISSQ